MTIDTTRRNLMLAAAVAPALGQPAVAAERSAAAPSRLTTGASRTETSHGMVEGYRDGAVHIFKGLPYAGPPHGPHRFARAPALAPWAGTRNAFTYGPICPQLDRAADVSTNEWPFLLPRGQASAQMEDCLRINIWTRGLADGNRRPVMLWLHGQGFMGGSSQDFLASDGCNLARTQDVVVASINHRVGPLGFMHLADLGAAQEDAGIIGMLDIIDALKWMRANAAAFGGDPDNITIFGESGGGFKVSVLLAMPEARGLFHKAIIQSGARLRVQDRVGATALARATLTALGLPHGNPLGLRDVPVRTLLEAADKASAELRKADGPSRGFLYPPASWWMPVAGSPGLPEQPWDPSAPPISAHVPLLVGTTMQESSPSVNAPELEAIGWDEVAARLAPGLGPKTGDAISAARKAWPAQKPIEILGLLEGRNFRLSAIELIRRRLAQPGAAPAFNYIFAWQTETFRGRPRAFHTSDLVFMFNNADLVPEVSGGGQRGRRMAETMAHAWASFARTGRPTAPALPAWPAATNQGIPAMILNDVSRTAMEPDAPLLALL